MMVDGGFYYFSYLYLGTLFAMYNNNSIIII
jgi:hypothetical protein